MTLAQILAKKKALLEQNKNLLADAGETGLSADNQTAFDAVCTEIEKLNKMAEARQKLADYERAIPTDARELNAEINAALGDLQDKPRVLPDASLAGGNPNPKKFATFGEQMMAVMRAAVTPSSIDPRLTVEGAATGAGERTPSDGGFLVQSDFVPDLIRRAYDVGTLLPLVRKVPIGATSNGLVINAVDETSRVNGSRLGGLQFFWEGEGSTPTPKKPKFRQMKLALKKIIGLMYATDELLADTTAFDAMVADMFSEELAFMLEAVILEGSGQAQPLGIFNAGSLITIAKESGQANTTIVSQNIEKMWARLWNRSRKSALWMINQDVLPQLGTLTLATGTSSGVPLYQGPNGLADEAFSRMKGRPVIESEHCKTLGTANDIILIDPTQYIMIDKGAAKQDVSLHVRFIYDEAAFRITYRCDGQPIWNKTLTPKNGTNTVSPFINLASRP